MAVLARRVLAPVLICAVVAIAPCAAESPERSLAARPCKALSGSEFIETLEGLSLDRREAAVFREITRGNFPEFLRTFKTIAIRGTIVKQNEEEQSTALLQVMPDYLAVGSDRDFVRMPMTPQTAQRIADALGCILPTRKIVDAIDEQAEVHLKPQPLTRDREAVSTFLEHHQLIEQQRAGKPLGLLIAGIKKDIVLSPRILERPDRLALYGWRLPDGGPIQPLTLVHSNRYSDYSHGVRLLRSTLQLDGKRERIVDLLADPHRCRLLSDEGAMDPPRYPVSR